jgi:hypothetical protein
MAKRWRISSGAFCFVQTVVCEKRLMRSGPVHHQRLKLVSQIGVLDLRLFRQGLKPASFLAFYGAAEKPRPFKTIYATRSKAVWQSTALTAARKALSHPSQSVFLESCNLESCSGCQSRGFDKTIL